MTSPVVPSLQPLPDLSLETASAQTLTSPDASGGLLERLALALEREGIRYCQWKGHWSVHRWSRGYGDVDLLVDHAAQARFRTIVGQLGFKLAHPAGERQIPGVEHYFGTDPLVPRLLHIHVHYRLLLGEYWNLVYRVPLEDQILEQSVPGKPFRVPSPTHTFLIFVFRMMLRQVGRPFLSVHARWLGGIQVPLASLEAGSEAGELARLFKHLSPIDLQFFNRCVRSLEGRAGRVERFVLPWQLHLKLRSHVRRPSVRSMVTAGIEKFLPPAISSRLADGRMHPSGGGLVLALIGCEGSGKSTCTRELLGWLGPEFPTLRAHLGSPPKSVLTLMAGAALRVQGSIDHWLRRSPQPGGPLA
ncbi:MAG TPA: nucleotidyltransferase family protein, partial [Gemmatimonadales bacterium]